MYLNTIIILKIIEMKYEISKYSLALLNASIIVGLIFLALYWLTGVSYNWQLGAATCLKEGFCHCEVHDLSKLFAEPVNVYSSLLFLFFGLFIYFLSKYDELLRQGRLFLIGSIFVFWGSVAYHGTLSQIGLAMDFLGIVAVMSVLYLSRVYEVGMSLKNIFLVVLVYFMTFIATYYYDEIGVPFLPQILVGSFGIYLIFSEKVRFWKYRYFKLVFILVAFYIFSYSMWWLGNIKEICFNSPFIHFHSLWHIGMSLSYYCLYMYVRNTTELKSLN